jgi:hypothetical protein
LLNNVSGLRINDVWYDSKLPQFGNNLGRIVDVCGNLLDVVDEGEFERNISLPQIVSVAFNMPSFYGLRNAAVCKGAKVCRCKAMYCKGAENVVSIFPNLEELKCCRSSTDNQAVSFIQEYKRDVIVHVTEYCVRCRWNSNHTPYF